LQIFAEHYLGFIKSVQIFSLILQLKIEKSRRGRGENRRQGKMGGEGFTDMFLVSAYSWAGLLPGRKVRGPKGNIRCVYSGPGDHVCPPLPHTSHSIYFFACIG